MAWRRQRAGPRGAWALASRHRLSPIAPITMEQARTLEAPRLELAWNGHRLVAARVGTDVRLFADDLREWTDALAPIAVAISALTAESLVVEGFACVLGRDGKPDFEALRGWVAGQRQGQLAYVITDLTHHDGVDLRATMSVAQRSQRVTALLSGAAAVLMASSALDGALEQVLASVAAMGLPGVLLRTERACFALSAEDRPVALNRSISPQPKVTNHEKVLFPRDGLTKAQVVDYYREVAPALLEHMRGRPIVAQRWPDGIDAFTWYQHRVPPRAPDYVRVALIDGDRRLLIENVDALCWMVNQAALTFHGWATRVGSLEHPDFVIIDLDPGASTTWPQVIEVALALRALLELLEAPSVVKTSGQKGLHVLVPLAPGQSLAGAHAFAEGVCAMVAQLKPELVSLVAEKGARRGRLFLDTLQNFKGKSLVLPYSVRAVDGAAVSTPVQWAEVTDALAPRAFTIAQVLRRLEQLGDLAAPVLRGTFVLGPALDRLRGR